MTTPFHAHQVVPDVIDQPPSTLLEMTYEDSLTISPGIEIKNPQAAKVPALNWNAEHDKFYLLAMVDPDALSRRLPMFREFCHWLIGNIPGQRVSEGRELLCYAGPGAPPMTGLHRYVFLVFEQNGELDFRRAPKMRPWFSIRGYAKKFGLGEVVAGNFFQSRY